MNTETEITTIAISLFERGFVKAAVGTLERGVNQYPDSARIWEMQGILLQSEKNFSGAEFALETASLIAPLSMAGQFALAACYLVSGHTQAAGAMYEHLFEVEQIPNSRLPELAAGLSRCGKFHLALSVCRMGAERDPESDEAIFGMAYYMSRLSYPAEQIIAQLQRAVNLAPHFSQYRLTLAGWYARIGCFKKAHDQLLAIDEEFFQAIRCSCCIQRLLQVSQHVQDERLTSLFHSCLANATKPSC